MLSVVRQKNRASPPQASLPAGRGSLASQESLSPLLPGDPSRPSSRPTPTPPRPQGLATIPEGPRHAQTLGRPPRNRPPPPTLPKPPRPQQPSLSELPAPAPPPESWQDETREGSEVWNVVEAPTSEASHIRCWLLPKKVPQKVGSFCLSLEVCWLWRTFTPSITPLKAWSDKLRKKPSAKTFLLCHSSSRIWD